MSTIKYAGVAVLLSLVLAPFAMAQTATTTTQTRTSWWQSHGYGASTTNTGGYGTSTIYMGGYGHNQLSSAAQQQIDAFANMATGPVTMPVLFGVALNNISPNFGDPRDGGTRTHEGEDIMAVKGTPIVSPTLAVVLEDQVGAGEGNAVYTANPGGETFVYMHLDRFGEGVVAGTILQPGALIGYVGNTGDASGGAAHLHLEIHNSSGVPTDPFPRLTLELTLQQKINDLATILTQTTDSAALAQLLVNNFRSTFTAALAANVVLPQIIINTLASTLVPVVTYSPSGAVLPAGDLNLGSSGAEVVVLQTYLIQAASGPAAARLATAGATGAFGPLTQAALVEYQAAVGISPASGYYGPLTRAFVISHPLGGTVSPTPTPAATGTGTGSSAAPIATLTRDLKQGMSGNDVRTLQQFLNAHGYVVAATGAGSVGQESLYFGPATLAAVIKFQLAYSIVPAVGYVGPITRAALVALQ